MDDQSKKKKILVLFYSFTGAVALLAREVARGAAEISDTMVSIRRVPESIPDAFFDEHPQLHEIKAGLEREFPIATIDELVSADAVAFGTPVHFGSFASQMKAFLDQLSSVYLQRKMVNKPASVFCVSGSLHGGEELTLLSLMVPLFNLGMVPIGIPYPIQGNDTSFDSGSPYGAIAVRRAGTPLAISDGEKKVAQLLGKRLANMASLFNCGCTHCGVCQELMRGEDEPLRSKQEDIIIPR